MTLYIFVENEDFSSSKLSNSEKNNLLNIEKFSSRDNLTQLNKQSF